MFNFWCDFKLTTATILLALLNVSLLGNQAEAKSAPEPQQLFSTTSRIETQASQSLGSNLPSKTLKSGELLEPQTLPQSSDPLVIASSFRGQASWYGPGFHGRLTANGERYNQNAMTAAHPNLKFGTKVKVTNLNNGRSVVVRINDRGPFTRGRVIDLSAAAARSLDMMRSGVAPVKVTILGR